MQLITHIGISLEAWWPLPCI